MKINFAISRIKNIYKLVKQDSFITDRFIYSLIVKYADTLIDRDSKIKNLFNSPSLLQEIPCMELIEVSAIEACCIGLKTACTFKRTKLKVPKLIKGSTGPLLKAVTSLDYSVQAQKTDPNLYSNMSKSVNFKYNKTAYYWIIDDYIYLPNVDWESIRLLGAFYEDVSEYNCSLKEETLQCKNKQEGEMNIPNELFTEIESYIKQDLGIMIQIPNDNKDDNLNIAR